MTFRGQFEAPEKRVGKRQIIASNLQHIRHRVTKRAPFLRHLLMIPI